MDALEVCGVCFSQSLVVEHGNLVCTVCGTQSQNYAEETMDIEDQRAGEATVIRSVKQRKKPQQRKFQQPAVDSIASAYCTCLQEALHVGRTNLEVKLQSTGSKRQYNIVFLH